ncbi:MAG TPA: FHA domain-containing protein [Anaerolineales bacterium]|nr:FHA domain-containing protein [Anaerolineales bacterium]
MAAQFQFVMRSGPTPGATFSLEGDQLVIGRDSSSGVAINDAEVSRKHARLTFQGGKYVIEDLGSTNGTFVNGQRLASPTVLKSGDVVSLGEQIVLMYEALSADAGATLMSRKTPQHAAAPAPAPAPTPAPAPQQYYTPPIAPAKKTNMLPIFIGGGVLLFICLCVAAFWYIDSNYLWCKFFPFITNC